MAAPANVNLYSNIEEVLELLSELERDQVPFAFVRALNQVTARAQKRVRKGLDRRFTLRNSWTEKGIRGRFAKVKAMRGRGLAALEEVSTAVYSEDWYMEDQEFGGTRGLTPGGHRRAVPQPAIRRGGTFAGRPKKRADTLLRQARKAELESAFGKRTRKRRGKGRHKKPQPFTLPLSGDTTGIFVREGPERLPITLLYVLTKKARIKPRSNLRETTLQTAQGEFRSLFSRALVDALKTRKVKGAKGKREDAPLRNLALEHLAEFPDALDDPAGLGGSALGGITR